MLQVIVCALVLYFSIEKFAPDAAATSRRRVFVIAIAALIVQMGVSLLSKSLPVQLAAVAVPTVVVWAALRYWCRLDGATSLKIAGLYAVAYILSSIIFIVVFSWLK